MRVVLIFRGCVVQVINAPDLTACSTLALRARGRVLHVLENEDDVREYFAGYARGELPGGYSISVAGEGDKPGSYAGFAIIGGGSNLAFAEEVRRPLVMLRGEFRELTPLAPDRENISLRCGAGVTLARVVNWAVENGWSGLEALAGIPGTLGGAVAMNAGANGGQIADTFVRARVFCANKQNFDDILKDGMAFGYRCSRIQDGGALVCAVELRLRRAEGEDLRGRVREILARRSSARVRWPNCGSVFRNPPDGLSAGALLERAGMKGERRGGLMVSMEHANYFENRGGAVCADFLALVREARERVRVACGVELELEAKVVY